MPDDQNVNYTREAFLNPINLGALLVCTITAFIVNDGGYLADVVLSLSFGMELLYLGIVPNMPNFRRSIKIKKLKERDKSLEDKTLFKDLEPKNQKRFLILKHLSRLIKQNFDKMPYTSQGMLESVHKKIEGLLSNYLNLLDLNKKYGDLVHSDTEKQLNIKIERAKEDIKTADSERLRSIKSRRLKILSKRLEKFKSAQEKYVICESQLETIEDAVRYIYEQSMTMNDPEELGYQLDNLLAEVEETSNIIQDIESDVLPHYNLLDHEEDLHEKEDTDTSEVSTKKRVKE
ncbi:MAG TPA: hypothetical protein VJ991_09540 [Balneolales bacterium]|nr:hypothetical protein [Balneolales bacterium]